MKSNCAFTYALISSAALSMSLRAAADVPDLEQSAVLDEPLGVGVHLSLGGGALLDVGEGVVHGGLGLEYRAFDSVAFEMQTSTGLVPSGEEGTYFWRLALGARWYFAKLESMELYGAFRAMHIHMAPLESWLDRPGDAIIGDEEVLDHLGGLEVEIGWTSGSRSSTGLYWGGAGTGGWIANGQGPHWLLSGSVILGYRF